MATSGTRTARAFPDREKYSPLLALPLLFLEPQFLLELQLLVALSLPALFFRGFACFRLRRRRFLRLRWRAFPASGGFGVLTGGGGAGVSGGLTVDRGPFSSSRDRPFCPSGGDFCASGGGAFGASAGFGALAGGDGACGSGGFGGADRRRRRLLRFSRSTFLRIRRRRCLWSFRWFRRARRW